MLKISSVRHAGSLQNEHVFLIAQKDCNASDFTLIDSDFCPSDKILRRPSHEFHFPSLELKKGDCLALWSRPGRRNVKKLFSYCSQYNLFWGLNAAIWEDVGHMPVICSAASFKCLWLPDGT